MEKDKKLEVLAALEAVLKFDKEQAELFARLMVAGKRRASSEQLKKIYMEA